MPNKPNILVVDDEVMNFELMKYALEPHFNLNYVANGEECLKLIANEHPHAILLDVKMPGIDGWEVCRRLKDNPETEDIPVIFVSGLDSTEERLHGYEVGGDDYLVKPFQPQELLKKVQLAVANREQLIELKSHSQNATATAMEALTSTGEMGVIIMFYTASFKSKTFKDVADQLLEALERYGLNCVVQVRPNDDEPLDFDNSGVVKPLEAALLGKLKDNDRILDFKQRSVINFPYVSVLIKNMPVEDPAKYGRYKDNLALLIEGADARIQALITEVSLECLLDNTKQALEEIRKTNDAHKLESTRIFESLIIQVEESFLAAGLTESQEATILDLVTHTSDKMNALYDKSRVVEEKFSELTNEISRNLGSKEK